MSDDAVHEEEREQIVVDDSAQNIATIAGKIGEDYVKLSKTFNRKQKKIANSADLDSKLKNLDKIARTNNRLVELQEKQVKNARKVLFISTAITIIAIIIAVISWLFPRKA
jgi:DNA polymerase III delta prime subunit